MSESAPIIFGVRFEWDETYLGEQGPVSLTLAISEPPEIRWELVRGRDPGVVKVRAFTPETTATVAGVFRSWRDDPRSRVASEAADLRADAGVRIEFDRLQVAFGAGHVGDLQPVDPPDYTFAATLQFLAVAAARLAVDAGEETAEELAMLYQLEHLTGHLILAGG